MNWLEALALAVVQGLTEFLPVSSSGHLVLTQTLFGITAATAFTYDIVLHLGTEGSAAYHCFPLEQFWASEREFDVRIGESSFTNSEISLKVASEASAIEGRLRFENLIPWPVSWRSPGIMGW